MRRHSICGNLTNPVRLFKLRRQPRSMSGLSAVPAVARHQKKRRQIQLVKVPGEQAFQPLARSACPLVRK